MSSQRLCAGLGGKPCSRRMSSLERDPHTLCPTCRGQSCDRTRTCNVCCTWDINQWQRYDSRKAYKKKSGGSTPVFPPVADPLSWVGGLEISSWVLTPGENCLFYLALVPSCWSKKISQPFFFCFIFLRFFPIFFSWAFTLVDDHGIVNGLWKWFLLDFDAITPWQTPRGADSGLSRVGPRGSGFKSPVFAGNGGRQAPGLMVGGVFTPTDQCSPTLREAAPP